MVQIRARGETAVAEAAADRARRLVVILAAVAAILAIIVLIGALR
jgi:hypothetical protein